MPSLDLFVSFSRLQSKSRVPAVDNTRGHPPGVLPRRPYTHQESVSIRDELLADARGLVEDAGQQSEGYVSLSPATVALSHADKSKYSRPAAGFKYLKDDANMKGLDPVEAEKTFYRFRVYYMACSELFSMNGGQEWGLGHYLFRPKH
ncbi:hypothetical protein AAF712_014270 [Marasmius tenuissimus]|uniref:Uncharacterized protein n=1 Tax=Marasmius tenuissimus TaxID=585030 RepID=A0ABR2ZCT4_9AGAR